MKAIDRTVLVRLVGSCLLLLGFGTSVLGAQEPPDAQDGASVKMVLDGIDIDFDMNGDWIAMYSTYVQTVTFPDRQGIRDAMTIAEERGKAAIVRWLEQTVESERLVTEVSAQSSSAQRVQGSEGDSFSSESQRNMTTSIEEFTRSFSQGTLRGVSVLEQGYDEAADEAWVVVGISREMMGLAARMQQDMNNPRQLAEESRRQSAGAAGGRAGPNRPGSYTARRQMPGVPRGGTGGGGGAMSLPGGGDARGVMVDRIEVRPSGAGSYEVMGEMTNNGLSAGAEVELTFSLLNGQGRTLGRASSFLSVGRSGSSQMFRLVISAGGDVAEYFYTAQENR